MYWLYGFGVSNQALAAHWGQSVSFGVIDTQLEAAQASLKWLDIQAPLLEPHAAMSWLQPDDQLVVSPSVKPSDPLCQHAHRIGAWVGTDIDVCLPQIEQPVIGITGSNGKSTVTKMTEALGVAHGIKAIACGNIGVPIASVLGKPFDALVLELSSYQLFHGTPTPWHAAAFLNLSADHIDWHETFEDYRAAKQRIFTQAKTQIFNPLDQNTLPGVANLPFNQTARQLMFGDSVAGIRETNAANAKSDFFQSEAWHDIQQAVNDAVPNAVTRQNWWAALALISTLTPLQLDAVKQCMSEFAGLPHRLSEVLHHNGIAWVNDSKATNVGATLAALDAFPDNEIILFLGGDSKGQDFSALQQALSKKVKGVVYLGETPDTMSALCPFDGPSCQARKMQTAVNWAMSQAKPGDVVLLSPACASFDQYANFMQRGNVFIDEVKAAHAPV